MRRRAIAIVIVLAIAYPTAHLAIAGWMRHSHGPVDPGWVEVPDVPRARGAFFREQDAATLRQAKTYVDRLPPGTTWLDFTNRGLLYFLLDRNCPLRELEVAFYEPEPRQRAVIARLENDRSIVAALVPSSPAEFGVDGVPNERRAPLVWEYLRTHFHPDYAEGSVVFWRRNG